MNMSTPVTFAAKASPFSVTSPALTRSTSQSSSGRRVISTKAFFGKKKEDTSTKGKGKKSKAAEPYDGPMVCLECGYIAEASAYKLPFYRCGSCLAGKNRFEPVKAKKKGGLFGR
ncbi:hypothetical protein CYMTET_30869 [Cymbomonas tetramitiformis]|uniref:Rubredoxin-like domain-containing protein n=1 Tax=Cymbomonas tetramitiformis TaxID=36881 RepID=A0AAE0FIC3_9CHLO|nr:hypothetical protein CYMTET_30869 [Cymbomonas tetramitiformis]|eukprot:gene23745-28785_t